MPASHLNGPNTITSGKVTGGITISSLLTHSTPLAHTLECGTRTDILSVKISLTNNSMAVRPASLIWSVSTRISNLVDIAILTFYSTEI